MAKNNLEDAERNCTQALAFDYQVIFITWNVIIQWNDLIKIYLNRIVSLGYCGRTLGT